MILSLVIFSVSEKSWAFFWVPWASGRALSSHRSLHSISLLSQSASFHRSPSSHMGFLSWEKNGLAWTIFYSQVLLLQNHHSLYMTSHFHWVGVALSERLRLLLVALLGFSDSRHEALNSFSRGVPSTSHRFSLVHQNCAALRDFPPRTVANFSLSFRCSKIPFSISYTGSEPSSSTCGESFRAFQRPRRVKVLEWKITVL